MKPSKNGKTRHLSAVALCVLLALCARGQGQDSRQPQTPQKPAPAASRQETVHVSCSYADYSGADERASRIYIFVGAVVPLRISALVPPGAGEGRLIIRFDERVLAIWQSADRQGAIHSGTILSDRGLVVYVEPLAAAVNAMMTVEFEKKGEAPLF